MTSQTFYLRLFVLSTFIFATFAHDFTFDNNAWAKDKEKIQMVTSRVNTAKDALSKVSSGLKVVAEKIKSAYPMLEKLQKFLAVLGPVAMGVSIVLSIVSAFLPQPDSKELAFMKENFDIVISGMRRIESQVKDVENVVIHEITKAGYGEYEKAIIGLFELWKDTVQADTPEEEAMNRAFFITQYKQMYKQSAYQLFYGMAGLFDGEMNNDLLSTATTRYKCNGAKIRKLCSSVTRTIIQGLSLEGAFYSYMDNHAKLNKSEKVWKERFKLIDSKCNDVLTKCGKTWRQYAEPVLNMTYDKYKKGSNDELAHKLYDDLSDALPQRAWFAFVYNTVMGFEYHGFDGKIENDVIMKWRENDKMVSVASFDLDEYPEFSNIDEVMNRFSFVQHVIGSCTLWIPGGPPEKRPGLVYLHYATPNATQNGLLTYGIRSDLDLAFYGTPDRFVAMKVNVPDKCRHAFYFRFDLFSIG